MAEQANGECAKLREEVKKLRETLAPSFVPYFQTCPKCNGQKHVSMPPWVAGDIPAYTLSEAKLYTCPVCDGAGIIERPKPRSAKEGADASQGR